MAPTDSIELSDYKRILVAHEPDYRSCEGTDRQEVVESIMKEIVADSGGTLSEDIMKGLYKVSQLTQTCNPGISSTWTQKIKTWYNNHKSVPLDDEPTLVKVGTIWNYRLVVQYLFKKEIGEHMEKSGLVSKDSGWLQKFQQSTNEVIESLGGTTKVSAKYTPTAKAWNEVGPEEEMKQK